MQGVGHSSKRERETITIPLPHKLSKSQRDWLKHEHSEALLGSIIYQLLTDPVRATSLLASLNSSSLDIDEALYLQEKIPNEEIPVIQPNNIDQVISVEETAPSLDLNDFDDDLDSFDWEKAKQNEPEMAEEENEEENDLDSLLGDFLSKMNK